MGVFLRWGVFGIIAVAALIYAYNALGHLAERRKASPATVAASPMREPAEPPAPASAGAPLVRDAEPAAQDEREEIPQRCVVELDIARRAVASRSVGEPLDRLLRIQEIAWQKDEKLRTRYAQLATRWYGEPASVDDARLRRDVVATCIGATP